MQNATAPLASAEVIVEAAFTKMDSVIGDRIILPDRVAAVVALYGVFLGAGTQSVIVGL